MLRTDRVVADTLEEVAVKAGIDPAGLRDTVTSHNAAAASGHSDPMGKPAEFVRPVIAGPFSLINLSIRPSLINPCPMFTIGGLSSMNSQVR